MGTDITGPLSALGIQGGAGAVLIAETLYAVLPGADLVPEHTLSRAEAFTRLRAALEAYRDLGGATIVDIGGLTTGRDTELLELLEEVTGVEIVVATGFGAPWTVGSHFTNNVSPEGMTVDRLADIFRRELTEGLLVPPRERLARTAALVTVTPSSAGEPELPLTRGRPTIEADVIRASARAAASVGAPVAVRACDNPRAALAILAEEGVGRSATLVLGMDRADHVAAGLAALLAEKGYLVGLDHLGWPTGTGHADLETQVGLVRDLFAAGRGAQVVVSSGAFGVEVGYAPPVAGDFGAVLRDFAPAYLAAGGTSEELSTVLCATPRRLLTDMRQGD